MTKDEYIESHGWECGMDMDDDITSACDLIQCEECGELVMPSFLKATYEDADADGNRGRWIRWYECPECGADINN